MYLLILITSRETGFKEIGKAGAVCHCKDTKLARIIPWYQREMYYVQRYF